MELVKFESTVPDRLQAALAILGELRTLTFQLDDLRAANSADVDNLTYLRLIIKRMIADLQLIERAAEADQLATMPDKYHEVEGLGVVERTSGKEWDNSAWDMEAITAAIVRRVEEAWQEGEIGGPDDAARLAAEYAFSVGGATLRVTALREGLGVDPFAVGEKKASRPTVKLPKID